MEGERAISLDSEEDDRLLDEGLQVHRRPDPTARLWKYCNFSNLWWLSNVAMGIAIIYLAFQLDATRTLLGRFELAGDVNGVWPRLPHRVMTFKPDNRYVRNLSSQTFRNDTAQHWLSLMPKGLGYVEVKNPSKYPRLPSPYIKEHKKIYMTAVNHQLHCLYMIMNSVNDLILNEGSFTEQSMESSDDPAEELSHCVDYLRQSIMCHGDTALEGQHNTPGPGVGSSDGWNVRHVCKPWKPIYNWLEKKRIDDRVWT